MNGEAGQSAKRSNAGGVVFAVVAVLVILGVIAAHAAQSVQLTTCSDVGTPFASCSQEVVPVTTQAP